MFKKSVIILSALCLLIFSQTIVFGQLEPPDKWNVQKTPPSANNTILYGVDFYGIHNGAAVGYDGAMGKIITTHDGVTWVDTLGLIIGNNILRDVSFSDTLYSAAVVGDSGKAFVTFNGRTWDTLSSIGSGKNLYGVKMIHTYIPGMEDTIYAVGDSGLILRTTAFDGVPHTQGWIDTSISNANIDTTLRAIDMIYESSSLRGIVVGDSGTIRYTTDGIIWNTPAAGNPPGNVNLYGASFLYDGVNDNAWAVGAVDSLYKSTDGGLNWTSYWIDEITPADTFFSVKFSDADTGMIVGSSIADGGIILHTVNGGLNWTSMQNLDVSSPKKPLYDLVVTKANELIIPSVGGGPFGWAVGGNDAMTPSKGIILNYPTFEAYLDTTDLTFGITPGDSFYVPISIDQYIDTTQYKIVSLDMNILYDGAVGSPTPVPNIDFTSATISGMNSFSIFQDTALGFTLDTLKTAAAGSDSSLSGSGQLMELIFDYNIAGFANIMWDTLFFNEGLPAVLLKYGEPPGALFGDVDNSGVITTTDATWVLQFRVGITDLSSQQQVRADVSGIGGVTSYDAALILQWLASIISDFPVEMMTKSSPVYDNSMAEVIVSKESDDSNIWVYQIEANKITGVISAELLLQYDNKNMEYIGYELTENTDGFLVETADDEEGLLSVAMAGGKKLNEKAGLISLRFERISPSEVDIQVISAMLNESIVATITASMPNKFSLSQNFPNPFNPETEIRYQIAEDTKVLLKIYNILGQEVRTLVDEVKSTGSYNVRWNGKNNLGITVSSGVYLYRIQAGEFVSTKKLVFLK
ncbi:T9SS type A sorting domain-containing protein [candidate division KSB1 bacterium]